ncbi:DUF5082 family protein [Metabacillus sp. KIGAM252]|uniref:DUF5082 family protein n=1 Tax=Metabacillus flavus TaxID=2823519 RepID=A0ABS5LA69_9BACI|nr:DUF5082 family protein [Metabacillus flavus]MBS2967610.1 DUF5082 family protein [Metabacillus flavus]
MLGYYYDLLREKKEHLSRLTAFSSTLNSKLAEFSAIEQKCMEPDLTDETWNGKHADTFDEMRESGIKTSFQEITGTQFSKIFKAIAEKITSLNAEIKSIQAAIASLEAQAAAERAREAEQAAAKK